MSGRSLIGRFLSRLLTFIVILILLLGAIVKWRYGGGNDFPARDTPPQMPASALERVADLPTPPGNISVSASGRIFVSLHPQARPAWKLVELVDGQMKPFPNLAFQTGDGEPDSFDTVLGVRVDAQNRLWVLDNGNHGLRPARLLAFDIDSGELVENFSFPREIAGYGSHLNDLQVMPDGNTIFISDASLLAQDPALIVYDVASHSARRVLERHPSVTAEYYTPRVQGRRMELFYLFSVRPGVDAVGLDANGLWLYFAPMSSLHLYRVKTADLMDQSLSASQLANRVEIFAPKTMTDGISVDQRGNVYLTDIEHSAIAVLWQDRTLGTLIQSPLLRWPDGLSFGPDGELYITCSSLQQVLGRLPVQIDRAAPYQVYRVRLGVPGVPGR